MNATGTAANNAANPAAATATCTASLVATPAVASRPARGPLRIPQPRTNSMSGPGVIIAIVVVSRNASRRCWSIGILRSSHAGVTTWWQALTVETSGLRDSVAMDAARVINDNGAWCWFQDERAVVDPDGGVLVVGSIAAPEGPGEMRGRAMSS